MITDTNKVLSVLKGKVITVLFAMSRHIFLPQKRPALETMAWPINWHNRQLGVRQGLLVLQAQLFISWQLWNKKTPRAEICNGVQLQPNDASLLNRCRWTIVGFRTACLGHRQNRLLSWNWKPNSLRGSWVHMGGISIKGNDICSLKELLRYGWKRGSLISIKRLTMT